MPELSPVTAPVQQVPAQGEAVQPAPNFIQSAPLQSNNYFLINVVKYFDIVVIINGHINIFVLMVVSEL